MANDIHPNFLLMNSGRGFEELGEASGTAFDHLGQAQAGMGLAVADVEGDGALLSLLNTSTYPRGNVLPGSRLVLALASTFLVLSTRMNIPSMPRIVA